MAHSGKDGFVRVGSNTVAEVRSWSLSEEADTYETTVLGNANKTFSAGTKSWSGSCECYLDEGDTNGQIALAAGSTAAIGFYFEGVDSGDTYWSGSALVTSTEKTGSLDGLVEMTVNLQGTGALSTATV